MELSQRIEQVGTSATLAVARRAKQMKDAGEDVVAFAAGEPDFDTPAFIKDAAKAALDAGDTKYTARGAEKLKQAVADKLARENNVHVAGDQVICTFGGKHAIYAAMQVLVNPGDKVLIPSPYWVSYPEMVRLAGGEPVFLPARAKDDFKITPRQILDAGGAKILILNSPCNPTGVTYSPPELQAIAAAVLQTGLTVLSDEIYEKLVYGQTRAVSFAALDQALPERTITVNGFAKTFSMPGWRLGWAAGPKNVIGAMRRLMSHETSDVAGFVVAGGLAALTSPQAPAVIEAMRVEFEKRGAHMAERLNAISGVTCVQPTGAFYCFPDISSHFGRTIGGVKIADSLTFAQAMLETCKVALVPGGAFGEDACVRLSFATSLQQIDKGLDRLEKTLGR